MTMRDVLASSPSTLRLRGEGGDASYELADDLMAVHGEAASPRAVMEFEGEPVSVEPIAGAEAVLEGRDLGPVYRTAGGELAIPTGRAFVRFGEGEPAAGHSDALAAAGYEIERVPGYAPHAAWVRATGGGVAEALSNLDRLERLPGVEHVEPQLLMRAARR